MAKILVVDDHPLNREFLSTILRYAGHDPIEAQSGREGLEIAREQPPDLVITDLLMPEMDGYEFMERLRGYPGRERTLVIFYTAADDVETHRKRARSRGAHAVLAKPCEPQDLRAAVDRALQSGAAPSVTRRRGPCSPRSSEPVRSARARKSNR